MPGILQSLVVVFHFMHTMYLKHDGIVGKFYEIKVLENKIMYMYFSLAL
jgi:hypothetical protein